MAGFVTDYISAFTAEMGRAADSSEDPVYHQLPVRISKAAMAIFARVCRTR